MWALLFYTAIGLGLLGLLHSYVFYPLLLRWLARGKPPHSLVYTDEDQDWPVVSVIMSAYNEERVIAEKIESLLALDYPSGKLQLYIGSDCSDDRTNEIAGQYANRHENLHFFPFRERRGKPKVINELATLAQQRSGVDSRAHLLLITDASVMPVPAALRLMARHFRDPAIGLVDAHIVHTGLQAEGISQAENTYISSEVQLKHREGLLWGCMMGPFGGCYALRAAYFREVPPTFLVDDFYITMRMFEQGGLAINELQAVCYEAVSHDIREEFRRKVRISTGNFQNLLTFPKLWWPPFGALRFAFFSHKVLRWLGPFWLLLLLLGCAGLAVQDNLFWQCVFWLMAGGMLALPLLDQLLRRFGVDWLPLRGARYFLSMNLALLYGFFKFLKGVRSNVWQPTKRN